MINCFIAQTHSQKIWFWWSAAPFILNVFHLLDRFPTILSLSALCLLFFVEGSIFRLYIHTWWWAREIHSFKLTPPWLCSPLPWRCCTTKIYDIVRDWLSSLSSSYPVLISALPVTEPALPQPSKPLPTSSQLILESSDLSAVSAMQVVHQHQHGQEEANGWLCIITIAIIVILIK